MRSLAFACARSRSHAYRSLLSGVLGVTVMKSSISLLAGRVRDMLLLNVMSTGGSWRAAVT
jgi:hypothetical protein